MDTDRSQRAEERDSPDVDGDRLREALERMEALIRDLHAKGVTDEEIAYLLDEDAPVPVRRPDMAELASLVEPTHTAVLVVDVQEQFVGMARYPPVPEMLERLQRFVGVARSVGTMVVRVQEIVPTGEAFAPGFAPQPGDLHIRKPRWSAFVETPLEAMLRERGIRTTIVAGLITDVCVSSTARDTAQRDFATITLRDCTAELTQARHEHALETLALVFGTVCDSTDVVAAWQARGLVPERQATMRA